VRLLAHGEVRRGGVALLLLVLEQVDLLARLLAHELGPVDHLLHVLLLLEQQLLLGRQATLRLDAQAVGRARALLGVLERLVRVRVTVRVRVRGSG
jgi:hypothetical protein